jgi:hypothetical protein
VSWIRYGLLAVLVAFPALADTSTKFIYSGTPASTSLSENVEADFIVSGGNLLVTLYNTTNVTADKQILTGVEFAFAGGGSVAGTVSNPTVEGYGLSGTTLTPTGMINANWGTTLDLAGYVSLTNLGFNTAGRDGIIASTVSGTSGLGNHTPYIEGPVQFTISGLGLTSSSQITSVEFNFGTTTLTLSPAVTALVTTPEPSAFGLASFAMAGLLVLAPRQRKAA